MFTSCAWCNSLYQIAVTITESLIKFPPIAEILVACHKNVASLVSRTNNIEDINSRSEFYESFINKYC